MIEENVKKVFKNIEQACKKVGRCVDDVTVVCATKMQSAEDILKLNALGIKISGENKVQELLSKFDYVDNTTWHFIGRLQSNKVKYIIDKVELIHSVDKISLCREIDKQAKKHNKVMNVLLEVNIAKEESKAGFFENDVEDVLIEIKHLQNINVVGLMSILPYYSDVQANRSSYLEMSNLYNKLRIDNPQFKYLSMGMSNDYEVAIECGSNMIRLGTCIFGERNYN